MSGEACHQATTQLQYWRSVVSLCRLDVRQQESDGLDSVERIPSPPCQCVRHGSSDSVPAQREASPAGAPGVTRAGRVQAVFDRVHPVFRNSSLMIRRIVAASMLSRVRPRNSRSASLIMV